jgi:hypothetical protein
MMITVMVMAMWADFIPLVRRAVQVATRVAFVSPLPLLLLSFLLFLPTPILSIPHPTPFSHSPFLSTVRAALLCSAALSLSGWGMLRPPRESFTVFLARGRALLLCCFSRLFAAVTRLFKRREEKEVKKRREVIGKRREEMR